MYIYTTSNEIVNIGLSQKITINTDNGYQDIEAVYPNYVGTNGVILARFHNDDRRIAIRVIHQLVDDIDKAGKDHQVININDIIEMKRY